MMDIERFDCTNGGTHMPCHGCYTMEKSELGDYVKFDDYEKLKGQRDELLAALKKYGRHQVNCLGDISGRDCSCGLDDAIAKCEAQS